MENRSRIWGWALRLVLIASFSICVLAYPYPEGPELWEGSLCELEDGRTGECVKAVDCLGKVKDIEQRNYTDEGRCSFWKFDEIVCCVEKPRGSIRTGQKIRPALAACERYKEWLRKSEINKEMTFKTVVFNGVSVDRGEFPQMVALGYPAGPDDESVDGIQYNCGGTLISAKHVLTAAHCVTNIHGLVPTEVALGTTDLEGAKSKDKLRVPISKIIKHPKYLSSQYYHDIAVIELAYKVLFSDDVRPACLATKPLKMPTDDSKIRLIVLGWGAIDIDGTRSTKLLKAESLELVENTKCSNNYKNTGAQLPNGLDEGMVCVTDPNTERKSDTCWGDSGGPLFIKEQKFPPLVGVTSFGQPCGSGLPGVYASVYRYLDWIESQVWPAGDSNPVD